VLVVLETQTVVLVVMVLLEATLFLAPSLLWAVALEQLECKVHLVVLAVESA
jgi:hypothetical protein